MNFKKTVLVLLIGTLRAGGGGCKKSTPTTPVVKPVDPFDQIARVDILAQDAKISAAQILAVEAGINKLKPMAIILYKTSLGNYGKLKVISIGNASTNYLLTCDAITYKSDGTLLKGKTGFTIAKNIYYDFDEQVIDSSTGDFYWDDYNGNIFYYRAHSATFYLYSN